MSRTITAMVLAAATAAGVAALSVSPAAADSETGATSEKPLRGKIYYGRRRIGGYSYHPNQTMSGAEARRFWDPGSTLQSPEGPFDSGFFFDSAIAPHGGNAPYQQ